MFSRQAVRASLFALGFGVVVASEVASAQIPISGPLSDATTGPLLSGNVYHAVGQLSVPAGATLTIQPGVVLKIAVAGGSIVVSGTLDARGTLAQPIVITEHRDDTAGGDSNGDGGATLPTPGSWPGLLLMAGSDTTFEHADLRYGGAGALGLLDLRANSAALTLHDSVVRDSLGAGLDLNNWACNPDVARTHFLRNQVAVQACPIECVPGLVDNTVAANGANYVNVTSASPTVDVSIGPENCAGGALVTGTHVMLATGRTLTLRAGTVVKTSLGGQYWSVQGALDVQGTAGAPVVLSEWRDDSIAGDTNGDGGATLPTKGSWSGISLMGGGQATLDGLDLRYGGYASVGAIDVRSASAVLALRDSTVRDSFGPGLDLNNYLCVPQVERSAFLRNAVAVQGCALESVPGFVDNTVSGNSANYINVTTASPAVDVAIGPENCAGGALVTSANVSIAAGRTVTLRAGTVIKTSLGGQSWAVSGTLAVQGDSSAPVVFSEWRDDSVAGDTNGDGGATLPTKGSWTGLILQNASLSTLDWIDLRYGGYASQGALDVRSADVALVMRDGTVRDSFGPGIDLNLWTCSAQVSRSAFLRNQVAVQGCPLESVPGFADNTAADNAGNYIKIEQGTPSVDVTIGGSNCLGGALLTTTHVDIGANRRVTLLPGVIFKTALGGQRWTVQGRLDCAGVDGRPVIFSVWQDDSIGGDTNNDGGATLPSRGSWSGLRWTSANQPSTVEHVLVRYAGYASSPALQMSAPLATALGLRAEFSAATGILADALGADGQRWTTYDCSGVGIDLAGGAFDLDHATSVKCGGYGIRALSAWSGDVTNSIAWNNTAGNYSGLAAGRLRYSDGSAALAGLDGNLNLTPQFTGITQGRLELRPTSPCLDSGDPLAPLDPDGSRSDMGAYPFNHCSPSTYCTAKTASLGCVPAIQFVGFASVSSNDPFTIRAVEIINNKNGLFFYGLNGGQAAPFQGGYLCVKQPVHRTALVSSGGNPPPDDCSGVLEHDFNAWLDALADPRLVQGVPVAGQFWYRDPASASTTGLSNAIQFQICP